MTELSAQSVKEREETGLARGWVVKAFGNLLQVEFEGDVRQGEVAMVQLQDLVPVKQCCSITSQNIPL